MTRARLAPLLALAVLGLAGCGGPLLSAEVVIDRFCFTQAVCPSGTPDCLPPIPPGGTGGTPLALPAFTVPIQAQLPPLLRTKGSKIVLRLDDGILASSSPTPHPALDGITSLDMTVQGTHVAHYARPAGAGTSTSIDMTGEGVDIAGLIQQGNVQVQLTVAASNPPPGTIWGADLTLCFYGKTVVSYF